MRSVRACRLSYPGEEMRVSEPGTSGRVTLRPVSGDDLPILAAKDNIASLRVLEKCGFGRVEERGYANARGEEIDEMILVLPAHQTGHRRNR